MEKVGSGDFVQRCSNEFRMQTTTQSLALG